MFYFKRRRSHLQNSSYISFSRTIPLLLAVRQRDTLCRTHETGKKTKKKTIKNRKKNKFTLTQRRTKFNIRVLYQSQSTINGLSRERLPQVGPCKMSRSCSVLITLPAVTSTKQSERGEEEGRRNSPEVFPGARGRVRVRARGR